MNKAWSIILFLSWLILSQIYRILERNREDQDAITHTTIQNKANFIEVVKELGKSAIKTILTAKEGFQTALKRRPYNDRYCLVLLMTAFLLEILYNYEWGNFFMYFRLKLEFKMEDFSTLMAITGWVGYGMVWKFLCGVILWAPLCGANN